MADSLPNGSAGPRWQKWLGRLQRLLTGMNITAPKSKRVLLLHYAGQAFDEIFDSLPDTGGNNDYDTTVTKLNDTSRHRRT